MGQSLAKLATHITFSTKHRQPFINPEIENELHAYISSVCNSLECTPIKVGGYTDHVHILCMLSKKIALTVLLEEVKKRSSKWIKTKGARFNDFFWQSGYAAFSVNPTDIEKVVAYIETQKDHHAQRTFQDELRMFLKKYEIEFDEKYVWD